jgi:hypothetical protein
MKKPESRILLPSFGGNIRLGFGLKKIRSDGHLVILSKAWDTFLVIGKREHHAIA